MGATYKNNIELTIFGESHGKAIGITIGNLPSGIQIDLDEVSRDMKRRAPGQNKMSTARKEADQVEILSGLQDGITTGAPLTGVIYNSDQHSKDYSLLKTNMRPGHSDYPAYIKYKGFNDVRGGGHFSGRITAPIVFAGNIAKQILKQKGIQVGDVLYQEMAKNMLYITVGDKEKDEVVDIIINSAKSGQYGHYGDGKIFVSDISEAYTISEETREDDDE